MEINIIQGDNVLAVSQLAENSVDAIITDSPYGLGKEPDAVKCLQDWIDHGYHEIKGAGFMGKHWDAFVPQPRLWKECYRVLKPGGHLLSFFGTRTYDWGTLSIRLAGFEIRDQILWLYGSGFPKSLDISKAIDKAAGAEREIVGQKETGADKPTGKGTMQLSKATYQDENGKTVFDITAPSTDEAKKWSGYGTALKPACEPVCVARKPLEGTVVNTVLKYGTGGIDIDAGRIETDEQQNTYEYKGEKSTMILANASSYQRHNGNGTNNKLGRFPSNVILDEGAGELLDQQTGILKSVAKTIFDNNKSTEDGKKVMNIYGKYGLFPGTYQANEGGASRFFYCAKASPRERTGRKHPTIKPVALMEYLVKMFCPREGLVLDPHFGTGTTGAACINTSRNFLGIDADPEAIKESVEFLGTYNLASFGNEITVNKI